MRKSDLKNGMVVEYKNGKRRLYLDGLFFDETLKQTNRLDIYDEFLREEKDYNSLDIVKVFKNIKALVATDEKVIEQDLLLWEREEEIDWSKVAIDTPVLARNHSGEGWRKRHFAGLNKKGEVEVWMEGKTSWSTFSKYDKSSWKQAKLVNSENK